MLPWGAHKLGFITAKMYLHRYVWKHIEAQGTCTLSTIAAAVTPRLTLSPLLNLPGVAGEERPALVRAGHVQARGGDRAGSRRERFPGPVEGVDALIHAVPIIHGRRRVCHLVVWRFRFALTATITGHEYVSLVEELNQAAETSLWLLPQLVNVHISSS